MPEILSPKEIGVRWFTEVWNNRRTELISELLTPDSKGHLEGGVEMVGVDAFKSFFTEMLAALPDLHVNILNSLSDGDDACIMWEASATHTGASFGLLPTGKPVTFRGITWFRIEDGKIAEGWDCWNQGALFATLGGA